MQFHASTPAEYSRGSATTTFFRDRFRDGFPRFLLAAEYRLSGRQIHGEQTTLHGGDSGLCCQNSPHPSRLCHARRHTEQQAVFSPPYHLEDRGFRLHTIRGAIESVDSRPEPLSLNLPGNRWQHIRALRHRIEAKHFQEFFSHLPSTSVPFLQRFELAKIRAFKFCGFVSK